MVNSGYSGSIMLAHDCCYRMDLTAYGDHGYSHVLAYIVPRLKDKGVSDDSHPADASGEPRPVSDLPLKGNRR